MEDTALPALPKGWRLVKDSPVVSPGYYIAVDPCGIAWVDVDGSWTLYVPFFRGDDLAVCRDQRGRDVLLPIDSHGTITLPDGRLISHWYH